MNLFFRELVDDLLIKIDGMLIFFSILIVFIGVGFNVNEVIGINIVNYGFNTCFKRIILDFY